MSKRRHGEHASYYDTGKTKNKGNSWLTDSCFDFADPVIAGCKTVIFPDGKAYVKSEYQDFVSLHLTGQQYTELI